MKLKIKYILLSGILLLSSTVLYSQTMDTTFIERFVDISDTNSYGTSSILWRETGIRKSPTADFVSKLWGLYGPPQSVQYEGFDYTFRDTKTGLIFTAYCGGSGPTFGGFMEDKEKLLEVLEVFDNLLLSAPYADCEVEFDTDYGRLVVGSKNGIPYEYIRDEN